MRQHSRYSIIGLGLLTIALLLSPKGCAAVEKACYDPDEEIVKAYLRSTPEEFMQAYPASGLVDDAILSLGSHYMGIGEYDRAIAQFERVISDYPHSIRLDGTFLTYGKVPPKEDRGRKKFEEYLDAHPNLTADVAILRIAHCYKKKHDFHEMLKAYRRLFTKYPDGHWRNDDIQARMVLRYQLWRPEEEALYLMAVEYRGMKNHTAALDAFKRVTKLYPNSQFSGLAYKRIVEIYGEQERYGEAIETLQRQRALLEQEFQKTLPSYWGRVCELTESEKQEVLEGIDKKIRSLQLLQEEENVR